jgi:hypothetical protein
VCGVGVGGKILQYSEMECSCARKIIGGLLESTVRYDSINMKVQRQCQKYYTPWLEAPYILQLSSL